MSTIGTLGEKSLHAALKRHYARPGDQLESSVGGFIIDIVREGRLIEIQTGGFTPLKRKLASLLDAGHQIHLIHPIPAAKWIVKITSSGQRISRRKSPKRGRILDVFTELVRIPHLLPRSGLSVEVVLTHQEELRRLDGRGSWRRKGWSIADHRLIEIRDTRLFRNGSDYLACLPDALERPFTNRALASHLEIRVRLAQRMTYTLEKAGWLQRVGKNGNAYLFA